MVDWGTTCQYCGCVSVVYMKTPTDSGMKILCPSCHGVWKGEILKEEEFQRKLKENAKKT